MGFNEKVHAFIAARFYVRLTEAFGERGRKAFIHATQYYAGQRGRRMAQRAIRDGMDVDFATYLEYGEWVNTQEILDQNGQNKSQVIEKEPFTRKITQCPWHTQFKEMGLVEGGDEYCQHLDNSICRGFNPYLTYLVPQSLHKSDCCLHIIPNAGLEAGKEYVKKQQYLKSFDYHCGHSYWAYNEVTAAIFQSEGEQVNGRVMKDFEDEYGKEMTDILASFKHTNFNVCD